MTSYSKKQDIKELSKAELSLWLQNQEIAPYRSRQILSWIYLRQVDTFDQMTDLSLTLRKLLTDHFIISRLEVITTELSRDGSKKYLFGLKDGHRIESVLIPEKGHFTLCISSQVGCALGCRFCLTGQSGFTRDLTEAEIIAQVRDICNDLPDGMPLTNIVFMGMGEPLANYRNLSRSIDIITDSDCGLKFSNRRVTVSTAGIVPGLQKLGRNAQVNLAVSLNATDNVVRTRLMPINRTYPLEQLLEACRVYPLKPRQRITFEYILIRGVNDSDQDAERLAVVLRSIRAKINLIPFNEHDGCTYRRPEDSTIRRFQEILQNRNYTAVIRYSKGLDISAACGQLRARST